MNYLFWLLYMLGAGGTAHATAHETRTDSWRFRICVTLGFALVWPAVLVSGFLLSDS